MNTKLIPVCGWCKKIKTDASSWQTMEEYLTELGLGEFTHGMCPGCSEKIFQKRVYLESYQNICKVISSSLALEEVLNLIVTNIVKVMNVKGSLLRLVNKKSRTLELAAHCGLSANYVNKGSVEIDKSIEDALNGNPVSVYDITEDTDSKYYNEALYEGIRSIISIPLKFKDEIIGVLRMYTAEPRQYSQEDLKFVAAIAEQAAIAIMNAKVFETTVSREKEYLRLFREVLKAVSSSLNLDEVLMKIAREIPLAMNVKAALIQLINPKTGKLRMAASHGLSDNYLHNCRNDNGISMSEAMSNIYNLPAPTKKEQESVASFASADFQPVTFYDVNAVSRFPYKCEKIDEGIKSVLIVPIPAKDKIIGILELMTGWFRNFSQQEVEFTTSLAEQCGIAIENAIMYEKKYREAEYLKAIKDFTKLMSKTPDINEILNFVAKKLPEIMNVKASTIRLLDPVTKKLELVASSGLSRKYLTRGIVDLEENIQTALKGTPVAIYNVANDSRVIYNKEAAAEGIKSILVIPLMVFGDITGVIRLLTTEYKAFEEEEIDFAMALAEEAAIAIENARAHKAAAAR
jgi:GAF domain-containing protein